MRREQVNTERVNQLLMEIADEDRGQEPDLDELCPADGDRREDSD